MTEMTIDEVVATAQRARTTEGLSIDLVARSLRISVGTRTLTAIPWPARCPIDVAIRDGVLHAGHRSFELRPATLDRMPIVTTEPTYTPSTFNTPKYSTHLLQLFGNHFGAERVRETKPIMAGEDFSQFWLADKSKEAVIFWVGGVPKAKWDAAGGDESKLPSLHSPFWAPDAEAVISTATEALTLATLDLLRKS